jgi:uncharacterized protein (DUF433 family)
MDQQSRIVCDPNICHGKPCIRGTRVLAAVIQDNLRAGVPIQDILRNYPSLSEDDIAAAADYPPLRQQ